MIAAECGKTLVYSYFMRHQKENKRNRAVIADGKIGRVYHTRVHYHFRERGTHYDAPPSRAWLYRWGQKGGALGQHGSHYLDLAWFLIWVALRLNGLMRSATVRFQRLSMLADIPKTTLVS